MQRRTLVLIKASHEFMLRMLHILCSKYIHTYTNINRLYLRFDSRLIVYRTNETLYDDDSQFLFIYKMPYCGF